MKTESKMSVFDRRRPKIAKQPLRGTMLVHPQWVG
jgi:hypothetical protein